MIQHQNANPVLKDIIRIYDSLLWKHHLVIILVGCEEFIMSFTTCLLFYGQNTMEL